VRAIRLIAGIWPAIGNPIMEAWNGSQGLEQKIQPEAVEIFCDQPVGKRNEMERRPLLTVVSST